MRTDSAVFEDPEAAREIQKDAEIHLDACYEAMYDETDHPDLQITSPSVGPFCGCNRCIVREVLAGAWPAIEKYFASLPAGEVNPQA
jgi:hypothetical protein